MKRPLIYASIFLLLALLPFAFGGQAHYVAELLSGVGVFVILAVSADLLVGVAGQISLGHAAFFAIGAYSSAVLTTRYDWPPIVALGAGVLLTVAVAYVVGRAVLRLKGYYLAMATLGLTAVVFTLLVGWREVTGGAAGLGAVPRFSLLGFSFTDPLHYYYLMLAVALAVIALCKTLAASAYGRALVAIHGDEQTATALGVDVARYKVSAFVLTAALAAVAGSLFTHHLRFIAPADFTIAQSIHILVMAFLGGIGSIFGAALGAVTLQLLPEFIHQFQDYQELITGVVLMAVLAFFPRGLWGLVQSVGTRLRAPRRPVPLAEQELKR